MATLTAGSLVRTRQAIVGQTVVVEVPERPGSGVVTGFAAHSEPLFVFVLILVAGVAVLRCVFVTVCFMAALARRDHMAAGQRESGGAMVKGRRLPRLVRVTLCAPYAQLPIMLVILLVATQAVAWCVPETAQILVAGVTFGHYFGMGIAQRKARAIVTEAPGRGFPVAFGVAFNALDT